jgi:hypothetical protein
MHRFSSDPERTLYFIHIKIILATRFSKLRILPHKYWKLQLRQTALTNMNRLCPLPRHRSIASRVGLRRTTPMISSVGEHRTVLAVATVRRPVRVDATDRRTRRLRVGEDVGLVLRMRHGLSVEEAVDAVNLQL